MLLEDRLSGGGHARLYSRPADVVRCDDPDDVDQALQMIEGGLAAGLHAAGFFAYELGLRLEPQLASRMPANRMAPLLWVGLFPPPQRMAGEAVDALFGSLAPPPPITDIRPGHDRATHVAKVRHVLARIATGDIYQANLTFPMRFRYMGDPLALYAAMRAVQPVAHGGLILLDGAAILSVSPELFLRIEGDRVEARPMKGTAPRGATASDDEAARGRLAADAKQRAENLMIVDLLRNDLARISENGSVAAPSLFTVESYPTFHTLTSTVTARLRPGVGLRERLRATFPCGSIVGAPKIRAAEILAEVEQEARGIYTGAIGSIAPSGDLDLNVAIRTAVLSADGSGSYGVGGGIVADSDPSAEYDEALLKARVISDLATPFELIETFRWVAASGYVRLGEHLRRLARSAEMLGFACDVGEIEARLAASVAARAPPAEDRRVRVALNRAGEVAITSEAIAPQPACMRLLVATARLDAADPFLRHKTSRRAVYEAALAEALAAGADEALLLNRRGAVADGSRNSLFVEVDGRLLTPRSADGALPGVLRATMIARGEAAEGRVTPEMLARANRLLIGNSLHGLRPAVLASAAA